MFKIGQSNNSNIDMLVRNVEKKVVKRIETGQPGEVEMRNGKRLV